MGFKKEIQGKILIFTLDADLTTDLAKKMTEEISAEVATWPDLQKMVIDFLGQYTIDTAAFRTLSPICVGLRKNRKAFFLLNPDSALETFVRDMGLSSLLKPVHSMQEVIKEPLPGIPPVANIFDVNFINPFIQGTIAIMKVQCYLDCTPQKPTVKEKLDPRMVIDIAGLIGITSTAFTGSVALCFPEKTFLAAMSNMLGEQQTEINSELEEGAGELVNVVFGHSKKVLNEQGHTLEKALPSVIRGKNIDVKLMAAMPAILIPFESSAGWFYLEIGTRNK